MLTILALTVAAPQQAQAFDMPGYEEPAKPWEDVLAEADQKLCEQEIRQIRAELGKPELERAPASEEPEAEVIYAVNRMENGCPMLVMHGDVTDIRPLPQVEEKPALRPLD